MARKKRTAPANNASKKRSDPTGSAVRNALERDQSPLERIFDKAATSLESKTQGDAAFDCYRGHLQSLKNDYLAREFDPTPENGIELKKKLFTVEEETEEMKETIKEIRGGVDELVDELVKDAGHCCSIEKMHVLHNLQCGGNVECRILPGENFCRVLDRNGEETTETCCLKKVCGRQQYLSKHPGAVLSDKVERNEYQQSDIEVLLQCTKCRTHHHATCTMYHPAKDGRNFICPRCCPSKITILRAEELETTKPTEFMEKELNQANLKILCRALFAAKKNGDYLQKNKNRFPNLTRLPQVPYIQKTYGFFIERDGVDVLIFVLITHEYKNVASRRNNTIHVEYLDSVRYMENQASAVNKSIFQAFCSYARYAGFEKIHLWACAPHENDNYVLHGHPGPPRERNDQRLFKWYFAAGDCEAVEKISRGFDKSLDRTLKDLLDAVCYENNPILDEVEETLNDNKTETHNKLIAKLRGTLYRYEKHMFYLKLKKADQEGLQRHKEELFDGGFASSESFYDNQQSRKFEFHRLDSAKFATQMIICAVKEERRNPEIQKLIGPIFESAPLAAIPQPVPVALPIPPAQPHVENPIVTQVNAPALLHAINRPPQPQMLPTPAALANPRNTPPPGPQAGYPNIGGMNAPLPQRAALAITQSRAPVTPDSQNERNSQIGFWFRDICPVINRDGTRYRFDQS